jgi:hypothetical protein
MATASEEPLQRDQFDRLQPGQGPSERVSELLPSAAERLALLAQEARGAERPAVEVVLGGDVRVRLTQADQGVELSIQGKDQQLQHLQASVPELLEALHGYGVRVTQVRIRGDVIGHGRQSSSARPAVSR